MRLSKNCEEIWFIYWCEKYQENSNRSITFFVYSSQNTSLDRFEPQFFPNTASTCRTFPTPSQPSAPYFLRRPRQCDLLSPNQRPSTSQSLYFQILAPVLRTTYLIMEHGPSSRGANHPSTLNIAPAI